MPLSNKSTPRQSFSPSPTYGGDVINKLLHVKDSINSTLLTQHQHTTQLANLLFEIEEQIRDATELALKNIKTDIEKSKRKITPGIKRLQDCLKG